MAFNQNVNIVYTQEKSWKIIPRLTSEIGATLKGKNLLPEGANSFLQGKSLWWRKKIFYVGDLSLLQIFFSTNIHNECYAHG